MTGLYQFIVEKASIKNVIIGLILIVMFNTFFLPFLPSVLWGFHLPIDKILDLRFSYNANDIFSLFDEFGAKGRNSYKLSALSIDSPYAIIYSITYAIIIYLLLKSNDLLKYKMLILLPFLIGMFDIFENVSIALMSHYYPIKMMSLANATPYFTLFKWLFSALVFITVMVNILMYSFNKIKAN
ncbi:MAG: hypothetical protein V3U80_01905 [Flavobacteriaceae bacterium]